jgi:hypothetical protein
MKDGVAIMDVISPILAVNGGWVLLVSTPFGKNHQWHLHMMARELKDWYVLFKKTSEINHVPQEALEAERKRMSPEKFLQEYECSYERGVEGTYYGRALEDIRQRGQITSVAWEPGLLTHVAIDIGVSDATTMIWFQSVGEGTVIRIIDCYSNNGVGLDHYAKILQDKPYRMGVYLAPFDLKVREWGGGAITRYEKARQLGIDFTILDQIGIADGIENVLTHFPKFWIDENKCRSLIDALENYYREWDESKRKYNDKPLKNWAAHYCFTADTKVLTRIGMRPIIELKDNDEVLTLEGWKPCTRSMKIKENARLVEVKFDDNTKVRCTPDHMFLMESEWISARDLQKDMLIQSYSTNGYNIFREIFIDCIKTSDISALSLKDCILMYGKQLLEICQKDVISIIKIRIPQIMHCPILFACLKKNIELYLNHIIQESQKYVETLQEDGMDRPKAYNGTNSKQFDVSHGKIGNTKQDNVGFVEKILMLLSEMENLHINGVTRIVRPLRVVSVEKLKEREDVFCISVPSIGHFSLANGAIVKNCDALRYLCMGLHKTTAGLSADKFNEIRNKHIYGNRQNPWDFFANSDSYKRF